MENKDGSPEQPLMGMAAMTAAAEAHAASLALMPIAETPPRKSSGIGKHRRCQVTPRPLGVRHVRQLLVLAVGRGGP